MKKIYDCIVIGGGIAGLTAGIYLARYRLTIKVIDDYTSRAALIPVSHNYPAFPGGIAGKDILARLRTQYKNYDGKITRDRALKITNDKNKNFLITTKKSQYVAKKVILATGVLDLEPDLPKLKLAVKKGLIRHCLICDGYEVIDQRVALLGRQKSCIKTAFLLSTYSKDVTYFSMGDKLKLSASEKQKLNQAGIKVVTDIVEKVIIKEKRIIGLQTSQYTYNFDSIYSALGCIVRSELATELGAKYIKEKILIVNEAQETTIPGLYAVGDIVSGLNQMCVASAHAAIATTDIFNKLKGMQHQPVRS